MCYCLQSTGICSLSDMAQGRVDLKACVFVSLVCIQQVTDHFCVFDSLLQGKTESQWIPAFCRYRIFQSMDLSNMGVTDVGARTQLESHTKA